jgi:hypothetical protein
MRHALLALFLGLPAFAVALLPGCSFFASSATPYRPAPPAPPACSGWSQVVDGVAFAAIATLAVAALAGSDGDCGGGDQQSCEHSGTLIAAGGGLLAAPFAVGWIVGVERTRRCEEALDALPPTSITWRRATDAGRVMP